MWGCGGNQRENCKWQWQMELYKNVSNVAAGGGGGTLMMTPGNHIENIFVADWNFVELLFFLLNYFLLTPFHKIIITNIYYLCTRTFRPTRVKLSFSSLMFSFYFSVIYPAERNTWRTCLEVFQDWEITIHSLPQLPNVKFPLRTLTSVSGFHGFQRPHRYLLEPAPAESTKPIRPNPGSLSLCTPLDSTGPKIQ